jgi:hypothetical protein
MGPRLAAHGARAAPHLGAPVQRLLPPPAPPSAAAAAALRHLRHLRHLELPRGDGVQVKQRALTFAEVLVPADLLAAPIVQRRKLNERKG